MVRGTGWPSLIGMTLGIFVLVSSWYSTCAFRPGGNTPVRLTPEGLFVSPDGEIMEEKEVR